MRATWSTPTSNIQKLVLYHHHANWALLDRRVQALCIRGLQLRMISSTAEHMSRVERAPSTRERATKCFSPTGLREGRQRACHKPKRNSQDPVIHFCVLESARSITQLLFCPDLPSSDISYFQRIQFTIELLCLGSDGKPKGCVALPFGNQYLVFPTEMVRQIVQLS